MPSQQSVEGIVAAMAGEGAYVVSSQEYGGDEGAAPYVEMSIRVPAARFDEVMDRLAGLAVRVTSRSESGQDVTEEYVDLEARLESLETARQRLLEIMQQASTTNTRDGEKTLAPYLGNRSIPELTVRQVRFTYAELEAIQAQAMRELDKLDFDVSVATSVPDNRVEVYVSDRAWFESELQRVGARLPEEVEFVVVKGGSTVKDKDLLLTPPVPGIAFPRQKPTEGFRESMTAELIGTLRLEDACLQVQPLGGGVLLPIWPPEFTLRTEGEQVLVIDGEGQVAARAGEEVYMSDTTTTTRPASPA
jgi:hypothetical protein